MNKIPLENVAPEFSDEIQRSLEADGLFELAAQVGGLEIVDLCGCDQSNCSTFYTLPKPDGAYGPTHENVVIDSKTGLVVLDVVDHKIACIEVPDRADVKEKLSNILAELKGGSE